MGDDELCFPQLLNSSCRKLKRSQSETMVVSFVLCFISLITACLNLLVIISISHFKQLHSSTNLVLLSLAVSDFFVGLLMLFQIMLLDGCWYLGNLMCLLYYVLDTVITSASIGNMVLISVDRYVAICDPLHYPIKVTPKRARICVSLCWICSLCYNIILLRDNFQQPGKFNSCSGECVVIVGVIEQITDLCLTFIFPIAIILVLYLKVFVAAVSQIRVMRVHTVAVTHQHSGKIIKKSEIKAARTLGVVVVVFLMSLCPYFCFTLAVQEPLLNYSSLIFFTCIFYFNSCLNPVIYAFVYAWFRKSIKIIISLQILKSGSCDTNIL
ncbi:trace amine-associated receptor 8a-like [Kryptolebias marmoratus]|uniref:trace amine-associated receptor 8a-like n=1 Tax=Kryptolebias marmoratus TaxID=37003 RepID=UPI000D530885|nr:trace amine-associated receptor 8a-like [Kryptolebias marmoratus]